MTAPTVAAGPCDLVPWNAASGAEVRRKVKPWSRGNFWLEGAVSTDFGSEPSVMMTGDTSAEIDGDYETAADMIQPAAAAL